MGMDLLIVEAPDYTSWDAKEWSLYWRNHEEYDSVRLGGGYAVASVIEMVFQYAEGGGSGSKYPLFSRLSTDAQGWIYHDIERLRVEVEAIAFIFKNLDIDKQLKLKVDGASGTMIVANCSVRECEDIACEFVKKFPERSCRNLYDVNHYFFESLLDAVNKAEHCRGSILIWG